MRNYFYLGEVSIRDKENNSLVCDIPQKSIKLIEILSTTTIKLITSSNLQLAFEFDLESSLTKFIKLYPENKITYSQQQQNQQKQQRNSQSNLFNQSSFFDENGKFPSCKENKKLQEFFLQLLFSEGFDEFVLQTEEWLRDYSSKVDSYLSNQDSKEQEQEQEQDREENI